MKPDLRNILQERFHRHEADVDPGVWEAIQAQIAVPAPDPVEELFRERFQGHEVAVDPSAWSAIGSQIGHGAAAGTVASGGSVAGWFAAASAVVIISIGAFLYNSTESDTSIAAIQEPTQTKVGGMIETADPIVPKEEVQSAPVAPENEVSSAEVTEKTTNISADRSGHSASEKSVAKAEGKTGGTGGKTASPSTIEPRMSVATPAIPSGSKLPEEGSAVVESVITKLAEEVHLEAQASEVPDPVGPPPVRTEPAEQADRNVQTHASVELPDIFLPNTFTPNGDGINDTYRVDLDGFQTMMIRIYSLADNRLVFSTDNNAEWDGANCEKGYYLVAIEATTADGRIVTKGKAVWLNNDRY